MDAVFAPPTHEGRKNALRFYLAIVRANLREMAAHCRERSTDDDTVADYLDDDGVLKPFGYVAACDELREQWLDYRRIMRKAHVAGLISGRWSKSL